MEGDAGASRLNPNDTDDSSSSEVTAEDSAESQDAADREITEVERRGFGRIPGRRRPRDHRVERRGFGRIGER